MENNEQQLTTCKAQYSKTIICPHCGHEFLAGEVLFPDNVIGQPTNIVRDALGHVIYNEWKEDCEPSAEETYYCDNCGKPFTIEIEINYKTKEVPAELDMSETTVKLW